MVDIIEAYNTAAEGANSYKQYAAIVTLRKELEGLLRTVEICENGSHENMISQMKKDLLSGDIGY